MKNRRVRQRNQPCSCGSGLKSKKCCILRSSDSDKRVRTPSQDPGSSITPTAGTINPYLTSSMKKLMKQSDGLEALANFAKLIGNDFGLDKIIEMKAQVGELSLLPMRFNEHFADRGWIAFEMMNVEAMREVVRLADNGLIDQAEDFLADFYDEGNIKTQLLFMHAVPAFDARRELANLALRDYLEERYYACVPLLLTILDGTVQDTHKQKGFFAEGIELAAWDSISAHEAGLGKLSKVLSSSRTKTTTDPISIPYRNGILHGRDLNYGNKIVAAKCWAAIFSIRDWAISIRDKRMRVPDEPTLTIGQSIAMMTETSQQLWKAVLRKQYQENWHPRERVNLDKFEDGTPEGVVNKFLKTWILAKFGIMARMLEAPKYLSENKFISEVRRRLGSRRLLEYSIVNVEDVASSVTEVSVRLLFEHDAIFRNCSVMAMFVGEDGNYAVWPQESGEWKLLEASIFKLEQELLSQPQ